MPLFNHIRHRRFITFAGFLFVLTCSNSFAATLRGKVVKVADGDTITLLVNKQSHRIRLAQIDAPELDQPAGKAAKRWLVERLAQQMVVVHYEQKDRYGRIVGEVVLNNVNINRELVRAGYAWVYERYMRDRSLLLLQDEAQLNQRGLWSQASPIAPWRWRSGKR